MEMKFTLLMEQKPEVKEWFDAHRRMVDENGIEIVSLATVNLAKKDKTVETPYALRCRSSEEDYYDFCDKYCGDNENKYPPIKSWLYDGATVSWRG